MVVILKFPVYLKVSVEGNQPRDEVSAAARKVLSPHLSDYLAKARFKSMVLGELSNAVGANVEVVTLSEEDLLRLGELSNEQTLTRKGKR